jgi:hypothetical protein
MDHHPFIYTVHFLEAGREEPGNRNLAARNTAVGVRRRGISNS